MRYRGPRLRGRVEPLAAIAPKTLAALGRSREYQEQRTILCWSKVVGEKVAARSQPYHLDRGVLTVRVDGAAWLSELTYLKAVIRDRLNAHLGEPLVRELRLVPGTVTPLPPDPETGPPALPDRTLDPTEIAAAEAAAAHLDDPGLRAAVVTFRLAALRREPAPR